VADLRCDIVTLIDGEVGIDDHVDLGVEPVAKPPHPNPRHLLNAGGPGGGLPHLARDLGVDAIDQPRQDHPPGAPADPKYGDGDEKTHQGVCPGVARPDADGADEDRKASQAVGPGVVAVGHQGRTSDLPAHPHPKDGHSLVSEKSDQRRQDHRPEKADGPGRKEPHRRLVTGEQAAHDYHQDYEKPRQVLSPAVAVCEPIGGGPLAEPEGDPEGDGRRCVAQVVDGVSEERHAAGEEDYRHLDQGRRQKREKGYFNGPDPPLGGEKGGIGGTVSVKVEVPFAVQKPPLRADGVVLALHGAIGIRSNLRQFKSAASFGLEDPRLCIKYIEGQSPQPGMDPLLMIVVALVLASAVALAAVKKFILENSDFWMSMGLILADRERYERAARCCERAVKIYPFYVHAWNNWGLALYQLGRYEEALERLEEALTLNPDLAEAWQNKGLVLEKLERRKEAEEAFTRARGLGAGL